jgi:hypothetical protein
MVFSSDWYVDYTRFQDELEMLPGFGSSDGRQAAALLFAIAQWVSVMAWSSMLNLPKPPRRIGMAREI